MHQSPCRKNKLVEGLARLLIAMSKCNAGKAFVAHEVFTVMLCKLPVLSAVAHPDAGQIKWEYIVICPCDSRQLLTYASNQSKRCIPQIWLSISCKQQTDVTLSKQLCIPMTDATLCTCYNFCAGSNCSA